jgi:CRISPR system Cascade subunit CasE
MILSRAEIPWSSARNPYDMHRALWHLFPDEAPESRQTQDQPRQGFLFRVEDNRPGRPAQVLVQSRRQPCSDPRVPLIGSREIHPRPSQGQRLAFLLTANPVKTIKDTQLEQKSKKTRETCRVPLTKESDQRVWLIQKLEHAAAIDALAIVPHPPLFFRRGNRGGKIAAVTFEGVLNVMDPAALVLLLQNGIGPAKAFGCGLMLVRRITENSG